MNRDPLKLAWLLISPFILLAFIVTSIDNPFTTAAVLGALFMLALCVVVLLGGWIIAKAASEGWGAVIGS